MVLKLPAQVAINTCTTNLEHNKHVVIENLCAHFRLRTAASPPNSFVLILGEGERAHVQSLGVTDRGLHLDPGDASPRAAVGSFPEFAAVRLTHISICSPLPTSLKLRRLTSSRILRPAHETCDIDWQEFIWPHLGHHKNAAGRGPSTHGQRKQFCENLASALVFAQLLHMGSCGRDCTCRPHSWPCCESIYLETNTGKVVLHEFACFASALPTLKFLSLPRAGTQSQSCFDFLIYRSLRLLWGAPTVGMHLPSAQLASL